jgi:hypothetical protein
MRALNPWLLVVMLLGDLAPATATSSSSRTWMSENAMRKAFIGKTLDGHYVGGLAWTETYLKEGRLDYRESLRKGKGNWFFRGQVFCTFYDPGQGLNGGCWRTIQTGDNCYEFYDAYASPPEKEGEDAPGPLDGWVARGWRNSEPSTCEDRPSA